jgi:hypothetical protein
MTPHREIRIVKKSAEKSTAASQSRDTIQRDELLRRYMELRRAFLAFESFLKSSGIKPE